MNLLAVIGVELAVIVVAGVWFIIAIMLRPWRHDPVSWQLLAWTAVGVSEALTFLLGLLGVPLRLGVFAVGFGIADLVAISRLVLLYWARRRDTPPRAPES